VAHASGDGTRDFWIHFDADVLDDAVMPAVDYRQPGGLTPSEVNTVIGIALASPRAAGMEITIYNPRLDPDGKVLQAFVELLSTCFSAAASDMLSA
jgi:arginase